MKDDGPSLNEGTPRFTPDPAGKGRDCGFFPFTVSISEQQVISYACYASGMVTYGMGW